MNEPRNPVIKILPRLHVERGAHGGCVEQRTANGNVAIISHGRQQTALSQTPAREQEVPHGAPIKEVSAGFLKKSESILGVVEVT